MPKSQILVVDDNDPHRAVVKRVLGAQDYAFFEAGSAEDAITLYAKQMFDLILLDVMLPEMDGVSLLKIMREYKPDDDTPVIFMSARTDKKTIIKGLELGAIEYLTKPLDYTELKIRVATLLRMRKLQVELRVHERALAEHKALSEMLITLSHYINNAASSIMLQADVMNENDPTAVQEFRTVVKNQTEIIVNVIRSLQKIATDGTLSQEGYSTDQTMIALKNILNNRTSV